MSYYQIREFARKMRKQPTEAEEFVWSHLKHKFYFNRKFNRQYIISFSLYENSTKYFIVDFYCHSQKLIIEIDGPIHQFKLEEDKERDLILAEIGYRILRFTNSEVLTNWDKVSEKIRRAMKG